MSKLKFGTKLLLILVITVVVSLGAMITFIISSSKSNAEEQAKELVKATVRSYSNEQKVILQTIYESVYSIKTRIETAINHKEKLTKEGMVDFQKDILKHNEVLHTSWISFSDDSYMFDRYDGSDKNPYYTEKGIFQAMITNDNGDLVVEPAPEFNLNDNFIKLAVEKKGVALTEPYEFVANGKKVLMMTVSMPIMVENKIIGVAGVDFTLDLLNKHISSMNLFDTGYIALYDTRDKVLSHPNYSYVGKHFTSITTDKKVLGIISEGKQNKEYEYISKRLSDGKESYTYSYPYDVFGETWLMVCSVPVEEYMENANNVVKVSSIIALAVMGFIVAIVIYSMRTLSKNLSYISNGLLGFFSFLNKETSTTTDININSQDEFGIMAKVINDNISKTQKLIQEDNILIEDVKRVVEEVKAGHLDRKIEKSTSNNSLEELKASFNEMIEITKGNVCSDINKLISLLENFGKLDFRDRIENDNGKVAVGINNLAKIINEMLKENKSNGLTLEQSSKILLSNVDKLNISSNEAAASLEETAAALEEITSIIRNNTESIAKMAKYSNEITKASSEGEKLANKTTTAMDEINTQVNLVNEAISVIDNIAFQTNILSLNAAVEAATAGEAGKGFAVVAQEVRNLASRSAEAAKEIKDIVELATIKANEGKEIASSMIQGYKGLNDSISQTINLISDVEMSSKEQLSGIEQINDAVNSLDRQTQQNANIASQAHDIALSTDNIAKLIVEDANQKEFNGKSEVKAKNNTSIKHKEPEVIAKKEVKVEKEYKASSSKTSASRSKNTNQTIIKDNSNDDEWESF